MRGLLGRNPAFRRLWLAMTASVGGDQILPIAVTVSVLDAGGGAASVGLVLAARIVAITLLGLLGGVWADRFPRRTVMLGSQGLLSAIALAGILLSSPPLWVYGLLVFAGGAVEAFFRPAFQACLASVLADDDRPAAVSLTSISWRLGAMIGPGAAALLVAVVSPRLSFAAAAVGFALACVLLLPLREPPFEPSEDTSILAELAEGFREIGRHAWIGVVMVISVLHILLLLAPVQVLLPIIGRAAFGNDSVYAWALASLSTGALLGAAVCMSWKPRLPGLTALLCVLPYALVPIALLRPSSAAVVLICYFVAGFGVEIYLIQWTVALQRQVPADRLGRVSSIDWIISFGLMPLGLALTGPMVSLVGVGAVLWTAVGAAIIPTLAALLVPGIAAFRSADRARQPADAQDNAGWQGSEA